MSTRRSGRAKAPVKYTSASEGSDFEDKKPRKSATKKSEKATATPKKRAKTKADEPSAEAGAPPPNKRTKKSPETLAAEHTSKAAAQQEKAAKASYKKAWEDWVQENDIAGELLDEEPSKEESITQTDSVKKYRLKATELGSLKHFEKRNPMYNKTMKLFLEDDVKALAFRKYGMLEGETEEIGIIQKGQEVWMQEHKGNDDDNNDDDDDDDDDDDEAPAAKKEKAEQSNGKPPKSKTPKQKWTAYIESHTLSSPSSFPSEPEDAINQTDCKTKYKLVPGDLAVLPYFPKANQKYGNTTKLFKESEVKSVAYRKAAVLDGVDEGDEVVLLEKGKELLEEEK